MLIKKIHLVNFKRFKDLTIDLGEQPKRIVALVGPNGCGKSSVFDGMLYSNNIYKHLGNSQVRTDEYYSLDQSSSFNSQNVDIEFDGGSFGEIFNQKWNFGKGNTVFSFRSAFRYNGKLAVPNIVATSDLKNNNIGASSASDIDQRIEENYRRLNNYYNDYIERENCRPSEAKEHIIGELNKAISNCLDIRIESLGNIGDGKGTFYFKKSDTAGVFEYNVLSAGEKEVLDILLDLYLRREEYNDTVYIIDEPELHLNSAIQRKLLLEVDKIVPQGCQIWIATHSIGFLRALQEDFKDESQIIDFSGDKKFASESYVLQPIIKSRTNWRNLFDTALDDLAGLVAPKKIIYCEGRADPTLNLQERGLDANVYNVIFGEIHPDTLFVSSGGNTELDQRSAIAISILSKVFNDVEIFVLKDRDMVSGRVSTEADRQTYLGNNLSNHRVLRRFEIENYLYDKEVLKKYCEFNGLTFNEDAYSRLITNIADDNLKDKTGNIKAICGISTSINSEKFKLNLAKCVLSGMEVYKQLEEDIFGSGL